ncbi:MAG: hypothetical protein KDN22_31985 [Verrucomicrobiae bacterium]|nr:hypothetical protein [Verrucomicrobiae bacterium]
MTDLEQSLLIKRPVSGRFFLTIAERCAVDLTQPGKIILDECGGNPFPIHATYTVNRLTARRIAVAFANDPRSSGDFEWRAHSDMEVDWEAYV